jgi:hypothetical protein
MNVKNEIPQNEAQKQANFLRLYAETQSLIMKTRLHRAALCRAIFPLLLLLALPAAISLAQPTPNPPGQISYQGFLVDANGIPLATNAPKNYDIIFRIYNAPIGAAAPLWGELQTVTVDRGYFSVLLGQGSSVPGAPSTNNLSSIFSGSDASDRYIGTTVRGLVGGDVEIQPRMRLLSSPYSLLASTANNATKLQGYDWSTLFPDTGNPATGTFPGSKLAPNTVGTAQITNGAVGTAQIANGAVGTAQIANGAVGSAQIAAGAVGASQLALPLYIPGSYSYYAFFLSQPGGVIEINNPYVSSFPFEADYGLSIVAEAAIYANSHSGHTAYIADSGYAGEFYGNVYVNGTLSKTAGSFKIDHPLDPANKYLSHSFVESPDMKNIYDGVATLDANGEAVVNLPAWFEALNKDFRYQLTSIGAPGPNLYIAEEVSGNHFKIAGGVRNGKVSWQVTGVRHDAYANAHRIPVEEDKPANLRGTYISAAEHHQAPEKSERLALHPASERNSQER